MERLKTLEECYRNFEYFLEVVILLDKYFSRLTNLTVLEDQETLKRFLMKIWSNTMIFLRSMTLNDDFKIGEKYRYYGRKKNNNRINQIVGFAYSHAWILEKLIM